MNEEPKHETACWSKLLVPGHRNGCVRCTLDKGHPLPHRADGSVEKNLAIWNTQDDIIKPFQLP